MEVRHLSPAACLQQLWVLGVGCCRPWVWVAVGGSNGSPQHGPMAWRPRLRLAHSSLPEVPGATANRQQVTDASPLLAAIVGTLLPPGEAGCGELHFSLPANRSAWSWRWKVVGIDPHPLPQLEAVVSQAPHLPTARLHIHPPPPGPFPTAGWLLLEGTWPRARVSAPAAAAYNGVIKPPFSLGYWYLTATAPSAQPWVH